MHRFFYLLALPVAAQFLLSPDETEELVDVYILPGSTHATRLPSKAQDKGAMGTKGDYQVYPRFKLSSCI